MKNGNDAFNYKRVQADRRRQLSEVCGKHNLSAGIEHSSLYHREQRLNKRTTKYFELDGKKIYMCNVL